MEDDEESFPVLDRVLFVLLEKEFVLADDKDDISLYFGSNPEFDSKTDLILVDLDDTLELVELVVLEEDAELGREVFEDEPDSLPGLELCRRFLLDLNAAGEDGVETVELALLKQCFFGILRTSFVTLFLLCRRLSSDDVDDSEDESSDDSDEELSLSSDSFLVFWR